MGPALGKPVYAARACGSKNATPRRQAGGPWSVVRGEEHGNSWRACAKRCMGVNAQVFGRFLERRESGSCWDACGCFLALTARGPNSWRSRISWRCGYSIPGRRHGRQDRVAAALFPFFRCRDFFLTMRRAPLLTLWGNIRSAAARADRCKVLRVLLFGEQVRCEEPRFIFFRTCVFREEKQLVSRGLARLCVRYARRKRAQCDRRRAGRYGARTEVTCQRAVPKSAAGAAGCVIETLVYYKFQPLSRPKVGHGR
jgi:hypothetical protein